MNSAAHQEVAYQITIYATIMMTALMEVMRMVVAVAMELKAVEMEVNAKALQWK